MLGISAGGTDWQENTSRGFDLSRMTDLGLSVQPKIKQEVVCVSGLFNPSRSLSLKFDGSYIPSSSRMSAPDREHSSINRCQSAEFRARRETSNPITKPVWPRATSLTSFWKLSRPADWEPDLPRSPSRTWIRASGQPSATARSRKAYWRWVLSVFSSTWRGVD